MEPPGMNTLTLTPFFLSELAAAMPRKSYRTWIGISPFSRVASLPDGPARFDRIFLAKSTPGWRLFSFPPWANAHAMKVAPPVPEVAGSDTPMSPLYSGFSRSSQVLGGFLTTSVLTMMDGTPTNVATQPPVLAFQPAGRYFAFGGRYGGRTARASATGPNAMPISEKTATGLFFSASKRVISSLDDISVSVCLQVGNL